MWTRRYSAAPSPALAQRAALERLNLVAFDDAGRPFVNMSRLAMLHTGALRQLGTRLELLEQHVLPSTT